MDSRVALLLGLVVGVLLVVQAGRLHRRLRLRWRSSRARRLEAEAARILERAGYTVLAEQVTTTCDVLRDGEPLAPTLRADYLVTRRGRTYVAEAKSGSRAPDLAERATRRQLLEYAVTYDVDGVLLVDTEAGRVVEVAFPALRRPRFGFGHGVLVGAVIVALGVWATH